VNAVASAATAAGVAVAAADRERRMRIAASENAVENPSMLHPMAAASVGVVRGAARPQVHLAAGTQYAAMDVGVTIEALASFDDRQVAQWVANLSPKLRPFAYNFEVHQIDGEVFLQLDNAMLTEIGINLVGAC